MSIALIPNTIVLLKEMCDPVTQDPVAGLSRTRDPITEKEQCLGRGNESPKTQVLPPRPLETSMHFDLCQSNSPSVTSTSAFPSVLMRSMSISSLNEASTQCAFTSAETGARKIVQDSIATEYLPVLEQRSVKKERSRSLGNEVATANLQFIAAELASMKPKQHSAQEEAELVKDDHQITLGTLPNESTGTNKTHRRPMSLNLSRVLPPKPQEISSNQERPQSKSPGARSSPSASPSRSLARTSSIPSFKLSSNDLPSLTKPSEGMKSGTGVSEDATTLDKPASSSIVEIRSSEQEPSVHQTNIPTLQDFVFPARLCSMLDNYRQIDQNFDFNCLTGMKRSDIEMILGQDTTVTGTDNSAKVDSSSEKGDTIRTKKDLSHQQIAQLHKPILENFLKYSNDLVLEGFYHELAFEESKRNGSYDSAREKSTQDRMEVAIFSSDCSRQFLVVFQGSVDMQAKTIWNHNDQKVRGCPQESLLCEEQPVTVFSPFRNAYFHKSNLEEKIFRKLDELIQSHPFFDVVMTGFSFGGVLASIASMRYAAANPMLLISCFPFGCPKIGALNYRHTVNSLPNLKVMRLECKNDPRSFFPDHPVWSHAGHAIVIDVMVPISLSLDMARDECIKAYKFGQHRPPMSVVKKVGSAKFFSFFRNHAMKDLERNEYNIATYILALERMVILGLSWPSDFVGEDCCGVSGLNDEKRLVV